MGLLQLLRGPALGTTVGSITKVVNAKDQGAQEMTWSHENNGGVVRNNRSYANTLRVVTNSSFVGPIQIQQYLLGLGIVQGSYYTFPLPEYNGDGGTPTTATETDTGSFAHSMNFQQDGEDAKQWKVSIEYGPIDINHDVGTNSANPLDAKAEVKWTPALFEEFYPQDINGIAFVNTAGDPIEDPPKREVTRQTFSFTRNEATYNDAYAQQFRQTVNDSTFLGFAANQVKCSSIDGERHFDPDWGYFWRVNYQFEMRSLPFKDPSTGQISTLGWEDLVLNQGFHALSGGNRVPILINGQPTPSPVPLAPDGTELTAAGIANGQAYYLKFMQYATSSFALLNIPDTVLTDSF